MNFSWRLGWQLYFARLSGGRTNSYHGILYCTRWELTQNGICSLFTTLSAKYMGRSPSRKSSNQCDSELVPLGEKIPFTWLGTSTLCSGKNLPFSHVRNLMSATFSQTCICGHIFTDVGAFSRHEKGCKRGKKCLSSALAKAKEIYQNKRIRKCRGGDQDRDMIGSTEDDNSLHGTPENGPVCAR